MASTAETERRGTLAGCILMTPERERSACYLGPLAVHPDFQGRGLSKRLMGGAFSHAQENGFDTADLCIVNHRTDLVPFYSKFGFVKTDEAHCDRSTGHTCDICNPEFITRPCYFINYQKRLSPQPSESPNSNNLSSQELSDHQPLKEGGSGHQSSSSGEHLVSDDDHENSSVACPHLSTSALSAKPSSDDERYREGSPLTVATLEDLPEIMALVNDAYQVETGSTGVSFKKVNRYVHKDLVRKDFDEGTFLIMRVPAE